MCASRELKVWPACGTTSRTLGTVRVRPLLPRLRLHCILALSVLAGSRAADCFNSGGGTVGGPKRSEEEEVAWSLDDCYSKLNVVQERQLTG